MSLNPLRFLLQLPPLEKAFFLFSALFHVVALAYCSGYHHADEHFQILEFAAYKLGLCTHESLAWEYDAGMRSGLQPGIAYLIHQLFFGVSGQHQAFWVSDTLRLLSVSLGFISLLWLRMLADAFSLDAIRKQLISAALCLFPLMPYLHARFSSENFSSIFAILALILLFRKGTPQSSTALSVLFLSGFSWGIGFGFRYQLGLAALGCGLWLFGVARVGWKRFFVFSTGILAACLVLLPVDYWLYGKPSFPPANYLYQTLMKPGHMFGATPWYAYTNLTWENLVTPLNLVILGALFWAVLSKPFNVLNLVITIFIAGHCAIGHKEFRFLFPVFPLILFAAATHFPLLNRFIANDFWARSMRYTGLILLFSSATILNTSVAAVPASPDVNTFRFLWSETENRGTITVYCPYDIGYVMAHYYEFRYFRKPSTKLRFYKNRENLWAQKPPPGSFVLVWNDQEIVGANLPQNRIFRSDAKLLRWDFLRPQGANTDRYSIFELR